jgi:3',5'-cyclic AMP phosphodiesterase CpdA
MVRCSTLSRRQLLRLSADSLLVAGLWPGSLCADDAKPGEEFHFLVVNDTHYFDKNCSPWLQNAIKQMNGHAAKIDFCLLVGDLGEHGRKEQMAAVRDHFAALERKTYIVIGNHDYLTQTDRTSFVELFPDRLNYHFGHRGWQFVGLDTTEGQRGRGTSIHPSTFKWLDVVLPKLDRKRPTIVFTHFPLGPWVIGRPKNAAALMDRFKDFNLEAVFNGHLHASTQRKVGKTTITTNRCCSYRRQNHDGSKEKGYFLCHAKDGKVQRTFVEVKLS